MDKKKMAKLGVAVIFALVAIYIVAMVAVYLFAGMPVEIVAVIAVIGFAILAALAYFAIQRFNEINEGLEDAVDNY